MAHEVGYQMTDRPTRERVAGGTVGKQET